MSGVYISGPLVFEKACICNWQVAYVCMCVPACVHVRMCLEVSHLCDAEFDKVVILKVPFDSLQIHQFSLIDNAQQKNDDKQVEILYRPSLLSIYLIALSLVYSLQNT